MATLALLLLPGDEFIFHAFTIKGIPVKIHATMPALCVLSCISAAGGGWFFVLLALVIYGPILFVTILVHELGHVLETKNLGGEVESIIMWPLGGIAMCGGITDPWEDLKVAIAGPFTHLPMVFFWYLLLIAVSAGERTSFGEGGLRLEEDFMAVVCIQAGWMNICLFCFNLVPAYPLDGGRVMAAALTIKKVEPNRAGLITSRTAIVIAVGLLGVGIWSFVVGNLTAIMTVLIALWILHASKQLHDLAMAGRASEHPLFSRAGTYVVTPPPRQQQQQQGKAGSSSGNGGGSLV